jgi:hypothetical protein
MNLLKRAAFVSIMLLTSFVVHAELEPLEDEKLEEVKGQAGITIDIEVELSVGEFAYKDGGSILVQGLRIGGSRPSDRTYAINKQ